MLINDCFPVGHSVVCFFVRSVIISGSYTLTTVMRFINFCLALGRLNNLRRGCVPRSDDVILAKYESRASARNEMCCSAAYFPQLLYTNIYHKSMHVNISFRSLAQAICFLYSVCPLSKAFNDPKIEKTLNAT